MMKLTAAVSVVREDNKCCFRTAHKIVQGARKTFVARADGNTDFTVNNYFLFTRIFDNQGNLSLRTVGAYR